MFLNKGSECPYRSGHFLIGQSSEYLKVKSRQERDILKLSGNHTKWQRLKATLFPHLKRSKELAYAYTEAKVEKERSEARKIAEEAAEIAAKKDLIRQKSAKEFVAVIDDIFADDSLPPGAKALKLAKLMEENPQVAAQLENVKEIIETLALKKGLNIQAVDESNNLLPGETEEA
jgi:hypothetical protein